MDKSQEQELSKRKRKKNKKKNKGKDDKSEDSFEEEETVRKKLKLSNLDDIPGIPDSTKKKYLEIEADPYKIIISNIPPSISKDELKEYFSTLLKNLKSDLKRTQDPIKSVEIGDTKSYAILEVMDKEIKDLALSLDALKYQGFKLEIQKARGFFEKQFDPVTKQRKDPYSDVIANVSDIDNKIYLGGLPLYLRDDDVRKLCEAFGMLKYFNLVKDQEGISKGYCFFEYIDPKVVETAIKGLDNLEIGDRRLKSSRATPQANQVVEKSMQQAPPSNASGSFLNSHPKIFEPEFQLLLNIPISSITPSKVIQLLNMTAREDLLDDETFEMLLNDVKKEASKFGQIEIIDIPRPDPKTGVAGPSVGKVFIKYQSLIPAKQARHRLAGRTYRRRTVIASFYPEDKFDSKEYLLKL